MKAAAIKIEVEKLLKAGFIYPIHLTQWVSNKMPFGLKNAGATFQRAMSYAFHDIKHVIEAYLDDLAARSRKRIDHPTHLS
jgi:hypothetical protein